MDLTSLQIGRLIAEVEDLTAAVRQLLEATPPPARTWLTPGELAKVLGVSTRTVQNMRARGVFRPGSFRPRGARGYEFHKNHAVLDAEASRAVGSCPEGR